jgi:RNA recognition motif-containing protein
MNHLTLLNLLDKEALVQIASTLLTENVALKSRLEQSVPRVEQKVIDPIDELNSNLDDNNIILRKLFVRNISFKANPQDLAIAFSKYGNVEYAKIQYQTDKYGCTQSRGYGFIIFSEAESANRALRDKIVWINGRSAECYLAANGEVRPVNAHQ